MKNRWGILFGTSDSSAIGDILKSLKENVEADLFIASQINDLEGILQAGCIDIIILHFTRNKEIYKEIKSRVGNLPVIMIENQLPSHLDRNQVDKNIFTFLYTFRQQAYFIARNICAILKLQESYGSSYQKTEETIEITDQNLCRYVMELDQKEKYLKEVKKKIKELCSDTTINSNVNFQLQGLINSIEHSIKPNQFWKEFSIYFEKINPNFISKLSNRHANLTQKDLKYCCYLKMNMSNNDIKSLLGISQDSVRTHRYRLKKKLGLSRDQKLIKYLQVDPGAIPSNK